MKKYITFFVSLAISFPCLHGVETLENLEAKLEQDRIAFENEEVALSTMLDAVRESAKGQGAVAMRDAVRDFRIQHQARLDAQRARMDALVATREQIRVLKGEPDRNVLAPLEIPSDATQAEIDFLQSEHSYRTALYQLRESTKHLKASERRDAFVQFYKDRKTEIESLEQKFNTLHPVATTPAPQTITFDPNDLPDHLTPEERVFEIEQSLIDVELYNLRQQHRVNGAGAMRDAVVQWRKDNASRLSNLKQLEQAAYPQSP